MSHYEVLGVKRNASPEVIQDAFRRLAKEFHPDTGGNPDRFDEVSKSFKIISDPVQRAEYDAMNPEGSFGPLRVPELSPSSFSGG
jgi:curved DNA-binding protein CbpA